MRPHYRRLTALMVYGAVLFAWSTPIWTDSSLPGWLGLGFEYKKQAEQGGWLLVHGTAPNSPASKQGLRAGDLILSIDGKPLLYETHWDILEFFATVRPNQSLQLTVRRGTESLEVELRAIAMPPELVEVWRSNYERAKVLEAKRRSRASTQLE